MLNDLNRKMLAIARDLLETKGEIAGGLYNFYKVRVEKQQMLSRYEIFVIDFVRKRYPITCKILEPAAGIGTVSHALSLIGFENVVSCEFDGRRNLANRILGEGLGSKAKVISDAFPSVSLVDFDLVLLTNARSSHNKYSDLVEYIKTAAADVIMMPRLWQVETTYGEGCSILREAEISFEEIGFEMVFIAGNG